MSHPLTIDVPEEVFSNLTRLAIQQGKTLEALAQELVATAVQELEEDPLLRWAGAIDSEISDVAVAPRLLHRSGPLSRASRKS